MVMLDDDSLNRDELEHNREIADYLNRHPMFRDAVPGHICEIGFYFYITGKLKDVVDDLDRLDRMDRAIWISGDYAGISEDDCDWFFDQVENLWCEYHDVQSSGFFDPHGPLPAVPRGLLKIPNKI